MLEFDNIFRSLEDIEKAILVISSVKMSNPVKRKMVVLHARVAQTRHSACDFKYDFDKEKENEAN